MRVRPVRSEAEISIACAGEPTDGDLDCSPPNIVGGKQYSALLFACQQAPFGESMSRLFGAKLRYLRDLHHVSQAQLARDLGVSRAFINNMEAGRKGPALDLILRMAFLFSVTIDYLVRDTIPVETVAAHPATEPPDIQSL